MAVRSILVCETQVPFVRGGAELLVQQLVEYGVIQPEGGEPQAWVFTGASLRRTRVALWLLHDLELNLPGAAVAVDLLDEIARLQRALRAAQHG